MKNRAIIVHLTSEVFFLSRVSDDVLHRDLGTQGGRGEGEKEEDNA